MASKDEVFQHIYELAAQDDDVMGLFLSGSRGKKFANQFSDYDIRIVFKNDVNITQASSTYSKFTKKQAIDIILFSLSQLQTYAEFGSANAWDRYSFTHVEALIDKDGTLQPLIDTKGKVPPEQRHEYIITCLDTLINSCIRSLKCHRIDDTLGAKLEASGGILHLFNVVFGLEGRHAPFLSYLTRELTHYPLEAFPLASDELLTHITRIVDTGSITSQQHLMHHIEVCCKDVGLAHIFEAWQDDWPWFLNYRSQTTKPDCL
ncbi:MAG: aminoglycoside 6-adenylyltransferase [Deinococcota bacterium]